MFSNKFAIIAIVLIEGLCSCTNNRNDNDDNPSIKITNDSIVISTISDKQHPFSINIKNESVASGHLGPLKKTASYSFLDLVKKLSDKRQVALDAIKNSQKIYFKIKVGESIDTLVSYTLEPWYYDEEPTFSISGQCAPLVPKLSDPSQSIDLKKWLFRKKSHLNDEQMRTFSGLLNRLSRSKTIDYITNSTMPVLHNFNGLKYNVRSNLEGDYFILYAGKSSRDLDEFVEEVVANDFKLCSRSASGVMSCHRKAGSNGYMCISLIAIKKDWSYKVQPLGLVAIDNVAPNQGSSEEVWSISFPNNINVILPSNKPEIYGTCNVTSISGGGNGIECNVAFHISYSGDVKSVTVKRTKKLCYDSWTHKVENRVINVKDVSNPYSFTMMLHLVDGDNYIPVVIEDNHGNKTEFELNERATFTRRENHGINIDNNVNIFN